MQKFSSSALAPPRLCIDAFKILTRRFQDARKCKLQSLRNEKRGPNLRGQAFLKAFAPMSWRAPNQSISQPTYTNTHTSPNVCDLSTLLFISLGEIEPYVSYKPSNSSTDTDKMIPPNGIIGQQPKLSYQFCTNNNSKHSTGGWQRRTKRFRERLILCKTCILNTYATTR